VARLKQGASPAAICDSVPDHIRSVPVAEKAILLRDYRPGEAIEQLSRHSPESVIEEIKTSGLRGMGGAFFPTGLKWEYCKKETANPKYIVCNADEGEPGSFKDRVLLMSGLLLEGMAIAGYAVGSNEGIIYLRAEYAWLKDRLTQTIYHYRKMNLLGNNISGIEGFDFDVRVQLGAGAYVCGEETALLNSLEGKRGEPRNKRFFPTQKGYLQLPRNFLCRGADHATGRESLPANRYADVAGNQVAEYLGRLPPPRHLRNRVGHVRQGYPRKM